MGLSANAKYLLEQRYCKAGETPEAVFKRTAECLADKDIKLEERLFELMTNGIFLPNSPAIYNSGAAKPSLHACFEGNTKITTSNGYKDIATVEIGNLVLTHNGRFRRVLAVMKRKAVTLELKVNKLPKVRVTPTILL